MKIIRIVFFIGLISFASLYAMEKPNDSLEAIRNSIKTFKIKDFNDVWKLRKDKLSAVELEDILISIMWNVAELNDKWLQRIFIDRSLSGISQNIPGLDSEQTMQNNMFGLATMASLVKSQFEKVMPNVNVFLDIILKDKEKGFFVFNQYLQTLSKAETVIQEIRNVFNVPAASIEFTTRTNVLYYSCMLSNKEKNILRKVYFENDQVLKSILEDENNLSLRGYGIPFIKESKEEYGYINVIDKALILEKNDFVKNLFELSQEKNIPDQIYIAVNNLCMDKDKQLRVALDLLIIKRVESAETQIKDLKGLIEGIYKETNEQFLKKGPLKVGEKEYIRILDWLITQQKKLESKKGKDKDPRKKIKVDNFINLLKELNKKRFGSDDPEMAISGKIQSNVKEKTTLQDAPSSITTLPLLTKDVPLASSEGTINKTQEAIISQDKPDAVEFEGLLKAIEDNNSSKVQALLEGKSITDDEFARECLLKCIINGVKIRDTALNEVKKAREQIARGKPAIGETKINESLDLSQTLLILEALKNKIKNFDKIIEQLEDGMWLEFVQISNDMEILKLILTQSPSGKEDLQSRALYLLVFNSVALYNKQKGDLVNYYKKMKSGSIDRNNKQFCEFLEEILFNTNYFELFGINTPILSTGEMLLHEAIKKGNEKVVELLLDYGASADVTIPELPIITALKALKPNDLIINLLIKNMNSASKKKMEEWLDGQKREMAKADLKKGNFKESLLMKRIGRGEKITLTPAELEKMFTPEQTRRMLAAQAVLEGTSEKPSGAEQNREIEKPEPTVEGEIGEKVEQRKELSPVEKAKDILRQQQAGGLTSKWNEYKATMQQTYGKAAQTANDWYSWIKNKVQGGVTAVKEGTTGWYNYFFGQKPTGPASQIP